MCQERPSFNELCGCTAIFLSRSQQEHWDHLKLPEPRKEFMRGVYNRGGDYTFDVDCPQCNGTGIVLMHKAA